MSIDKDISDRLMEGRSPGDLFGRAGILAEPTKALAEHVLSTEMGTSISIKSAQRTRLGAETGLQTGETGAARRRRPPTVARSFGTSRATATEPSIRC